MTQSCILTVDERRADVQTWALEVRSWDLTSDRVVIVGTNMPATPSDEEVEGWVAAAMKNAQVEEVEPGYFFADVPGVDGAWMDGPTAADALANLPDVLFDWARLELADGEFDLPVFGGIDLNPSVAEDDDAS